jgi:hypothetical protein
MKLPLLAMTVFLLCSPAANCSRRHHRTLSATTKKTSLNGWLPLPSTQHLSPAGAFLLAARLHSTLPLLKLIAQTPSSL